VMSRISRARQAMRAKLTQAMPVAQFAAKEIS